MINSPLKEVEAEALPEDMDPNDPKLISLMEAWHGKDVIDMPTHEVRIFYKTCLQNKLLGLSSSWSNLGVQTMDFKVVFGQDKETKRQGRKSNKAWIQENGEQLVNLEKVM